MLGLAIFVVIASSYVNLPSSKARNTCTVARHLASRQQPRERPYRSKCIVAVRPIIAPSVFHCLVGRAFHLHKGARAVESSPPKYKMKMNAIPTESLLHTSASIYTPAKSLLTLCARARKQGRHFLLQILRAGGGEVVHFTNTTDERNNSCTTDEVRELRKQIQDWSAIPG